jgi:hypothetical protein
MAMTREQLLLVKTSEEAVEIVVELTQSYLHLSKLALKSQQFGLDSIEPGQLFTNSEQIHSELDDLTAAIEMLNEEFDFGYIPNRERIESKKIKVNKFASKSVELNRVEN